MTHRVVVVGGGSNPCGSRPSISDPGQQHGSRAILRALPPRRPRLSPPSPDSSESDPTEEGESSSPLPAGFAEIKDQWRRYGLAEGMRQHSGSTGARDGPAVEAAEMPNDDRLKKRVLELERALDIQIATVRQLVYRIDRLERESPAQPMAEPEVPARGPTRRVRLDETWTRLRARLARGRD